MRIEHEYFSSWRLVLSAAWEVHHAKTFGRCEKKSGIAPTERLIAEVMSQKP